MVSSLVQELIRDILEQCSVSDYILSSPKWEIELDGSIFADNLGSYIVIKKTDLQ